MCKNGHDNKYKRADGRCTECRRLNGIKRREASKGTDKKTKQQAIANAKRRAREQNVPFDLSMETIPDIPKICPILGIPLISGSGGMQDNSPSLDKIIPEFGYVPHNVQWISNKANIIKRNFTPTELIKTGMYFAWAVENVFNSIGALPRKGINWWYDYWVWYESLDDKP